MPLRIRIGNPLDPKALGKNLRILPDGTVATSTGEPVGNPGLPTERLSQASLVDIGGRTGLVVNSEKGFSLSQEPADPTNTFLVLHAEGDTQEQMLAKLSADGGLEIRRGTAGGSDGVTEAVIPAYPFCQGVYNPSSSQRVPNPNVIPSTFKTRPRVDYKQLNEVTYVDATFLSRLSMPEQFLIDDEQLAPLSGTWDPWVSMEPPLLAVNVFHPVRLLTEEHEQYRFFNHPYYAGATVPVDDPASTPLLYTNVERTCSYTLVWGVYDGSERLQNEFPVNEVMHMGGAPNYLMMFRCVPGGEPLVWDIHWIDGGPFISRFQGVTSEPNHVPQFVRDYPIWPQASLDDGISDNDNGAYFWGYSQAPNINTKREVRITPADGSHDQFHQVAITMSVAAEMGGEASA